MGDFKNTLKDDVVTLCMESYKRLTAGEGAIVYRDTKPTFGWLFMLVNNSFLFYSTAEKAHAYIAAHNVRVVTETKASDLLPAK